MAKTTILLTDEMPAPPASFIRQEVEANHPTRSRLFETKIIYTDYFHRRSFGHQPIRRAMPCGSRTFPRIGIRSGCW